MKLSTEQISFEIVERFAETRLSEELANSKIEAMRRETFNEIAIRLRVKMVDDIIWTDYKRLDSMVAPGIWNNIKAKLPWFRYRARLVSQTLETHLHHTCPHITIPIDGQEHFEWMRQGE